MKKLFNSMKIAVWIETIWLIIKYKGDLKKINEHLDKEFEELDKEFRKLIRD